MHPREVEASVLRWCVEIAQDQRQSATDVEAGVIRLASGLIATHYPEAAARLLKDSERYLADHPAAVLPDVDSLMAAGLLVGLPRFRASLERALKTKNTP